MKRRLDALDWIYVALAAGASLWLAIYLPLFAAPRWEALLRDFGAPLAPLTRLALARWFGPALAAPPLVALGFGVARRDRRLLRAALLLAVGAVAICGYALYHPVAQLAGNIRAE